jgi:hypothetical protein
MIAELVTSPLYGSTNPHHPVGFVAHLAQEGTYLDYDNHYNLPFGAHVEIHEENDPTNNMLEREKGEICFDPTANFQGSYKFLCLESVRRSTHKKINETPMPSSVIKHIKAINTNQKPPGGLSSQIETR